MKRHDNYMEKTPGICGEALVVKGTRVRVKVVLDSLAEDHSAEEIVAAYPTLTSEAVRVFSDKAWVKPVRTPHPALKGSIAVLGDLDNTVRSSFWDLPL